jgi:acyclic terpene utilization AtuA family protein
MGCESGTFPGSTISRRSPAVIGSPSEEGESVRVLVPVGMLGGGFPPDTIERGIDLGADVIAVDSGSTDSGPHYLGSATAKTARGAVARDLRLILPAAKQAGIPVIVGSCGTSGADAGVDWIYNILSEVAAASGITCQVARIYAELDPEGMVDLLRQERVHALEPAGPLDETTLRRCARIVGLMGHEPIVTALDGGAEIVLAGRATDTALIAAVPLRRLMPAGPTWHAAKIAECGGLCTTDPLGGGVLVSIDRGGFTVEPLGKTARCTATSVAAHMMYENIDPFRMREPAGTLDVSSAVYTAIDERSVRVEGSCFEPSEQYTIKLEGAAAAGFQTMIISGIRAPSVLDRLDEWCDQVLGYLRDHIPTALGLEAEDYDIRLLRYGHDAVLGAAEPLAAQTPKEVAIVFLATALDQSTATQIAKFANPLLLHAPLPGDTALPSFAFLSSPAEIERGEVYEFLLQHAVDVSTPTELFRTIHNAVGQ